MLGMRPHRFSAWANCTRNLGRLRHERPVGLREPQHPSRPHLTDTRTGSAGSRPRPTASHGWTIDHVPGLWNRNRTGHGGAATSSCSAQNARAVTRVPVTFCTAVATLDDVVAGSATTAAGSLALLSTRRLRPVAPPLSTSAPSVPSWGYSAAHPWRGAYCCGTPSTSAS